MNNNIIKLGRCALVILLSGLAVLTTAQVNDQVSTVKSNSLKPTITNQSTDYIGLIGVVITNKFVIEDDIMQSKDEDDENGESGINNGNIAVSASKAKNLKQASFTTNTLNQLAQEIKVYPVPANTFTNINLGNIQVTELMVINSIGQNIHSQTVENQFVRLDISNYQTGMYFIQMRLTENQVITKSIMVN